MGVTGREGCGPEPSRQVSPGGRLSGPGRAQAETWRISGEALEGFLLGLLRPLQLPDPLRPPSPLELGGHDSV